MSENGLFGAFDQQPGGKSLVVGTIYRSGMLVSSSAQPEGISAPATSRHGPNATNPTEAA